MSSIRILLFVQILFCLPLFVIAQSAASGRFVLTGIINGNAPAQLKLRYADSVGKWHLDSAVVNKGKFEFRGTINGPTISQLMGKLISKTTEDPNFAPIFLEPGLMEIKVTGDDFKSASIKGSGAQIEYEKLVEMERPLDVERAILLKAIDSVDKKIALTGETKNLKNQMDSLNNRWAVWANSDTEVRRRFIRAYGSSAVTANLMPGMIYGNKISLDSAEIIYNRFPMIVKNSLLGQAVKATITGKRAIVVGAKAPLFNGTDIMGKPLHSEDYLGKKYVLLNFWASWCAPCHDEIPYLNKLYDKYSKSGFEMIGISIDNDRSAWKKDIIKSKIGRWKHMIALDDNVKTRGKQVSDRFAIGAIPTVLLIDKAGVIVYRNEGSGKAEEMKKLDALLYAALGN